MADTLVVRAQNKIARKDMKYLAENENVNPKK